MKMSEVDFSGAGAPIDAYAPGGFRIGGRFFAGALLISPERAAPWLEAGSAVVGALGRDAAAPLLALRGAIDVLLIGLGADVAEVPAEFRAALAAAESAATGFGAEYMATPAACRTYNVLLAEERRVAAALLTVGEGD